MSAPSAPTDIERRLRRIYAAANIAFETDLSKFPPRIIDTPRVFQVFQDFRGGKSDADIENELHMLLGNVVHLEDHLVKWAQPCGKTAEVRSAYSKSNALKLCKDLCNQDKHGGNRRDGGFSKRNPQLGQVGRAMQLKTAAKPNAFVFMTVGKAGPIVHGSEGSEARVILTADIFDELGAKIGNIDTVLEEALGDIEVLLSMLNINIK